MDFSKGLFEYKEYTRSEFEQLFDTSLDNYSIYNIDSGDDNLALKFNSRSSITLYGAFEKHYAKDILANKGELKFGVKLFESLEYVKISPKERQDVKEMSILEFDVDISACLDLMNIGHLKLLKDFYDYGIQHKLFDKVKLKKNADAEVIEKLYYFNKSNNKNNFSSIKRSIGTGKPIYPNSSLRETTYIEYILLDTNCIKSIIEFK